MTAPRVVGVSGTRNNATTDQLTSLARGFSVEEGFTPLIRCRACGLSWQVKGRFKSVDVHRLLHHESGHRVRGLLPEALILLVGAGCVAHGLGLL